MRICIITIGSRGDVQPYIALGTGFKRAGYEVRLLTHGTFADAVREAGLEFADLGVDVRTVTELAMQEAGRAGQSRLIALTTFLRFMRQAFGMRRASYTWLMKKVRDEGRAPFISPSHGVGSQTSTLNDVSASRKMGCPIQHESHKVEL